MTLSGIRSPLEFRLFRINGITLHVVLAGPASGKPLIFLHGFPEFWFSWRLQIDHFVSSGYRVIIPDQRGYNLSDKPAGIANYSIDLLARDVVGVLDIVADSKAFVVGHDWGAVVTWYLAARYPERISRAAMLSVPHPRIFIKNLIKNPAQLRRSWYIFFFSSLGYRNSSCVGETGHCWFTCCGILQPLKSFLILISSSIRSHGQRRAR
jgi:epoxide hydrolase 4